MGLEQPEQPQGQGLDQQDPHQNASEVVSWTGHTVSGLGGNPRNNRRRVRVLGEAGDPLRLSRGTIHGMRHLVMLLPVKTSLGVLALLTSCVGSHGSQSPPATPATLFCALNQLTQLGYVVTSPEPGSSWNQATRDHAGIGESLWLRLVDDGRRPAWLDIRVNGWNQQAQILPPDAEMRPSFFRTISRQGQDDAQALRKACERA